VSGRRYTTPQADRQGPAVHARTPARRQMACGTSLPRSTLKAHPQSYEVIGNPPSISVPTHFAKVILASRPDFSYPQKPNPRDGTVTSANTVKELAMGAFVLPNKEIPDEADIRAFITPGASASTATANPSRGGGARGGPQLLQRAAQGQVEAALRGDTVSARGAAVRRCAEEDHQQEVAHESVLHDAGQSTDRCITDQIIISGRRQTRQTYKQAPRPFDVKIHRQRLTHTT